MLIHEAFVTKLVASKNLMRTFYSLILFLLIALHAKAQNNNIIIDALFNDWNSSMATYSDGFDTPNGIDLLEMQVTNDDEYIYFRLKVNQELCLGNSLVGHDIWLNIDADNDPNTGFSEQSGYGTELAVNMNGHYAWFNIPNPNIQVNFGEIGIQMAPTVTSTSFEIALPRNLKPDGVNPLFTGDTIRVGFNDDLDNDRMPDDGQIFSYVFQNNTVRPKGPIGIDRLDLSDIRVVSHNILFNTGFSSSAINATERVVKALEADLYCFQECSEGSNSVRNYFDTWLPLANGNSWQVSESGNRMLVSRWPISQTWYLNRKNAHLIDVPDSLSIKPLLLINGHLSCCTNNSGRQNQVDELAAFILDAKTAGGNVTVPDSTPIIFVGDMNFVGYAQQYETVITGDIQNTQSYGLGAPLDWDDSDLGDARPLHIDSNFVYTWRDLQGDGFPPGRLDYQFYSDAVLQKENAFILDTERMDSTQLLNNNLNFTDTRVIADHLPVVVDYSIKTSGLSLKGQDVQDLWQVYPNPARNEINISNPETIEHLKLYDQNGKIVLEIENPPSMISLPELPAGLYLIILNTRDFCSYSIKLALSH